MSSNTSAPAPAGDGVPPNVLLRRGASESPAVSAITGTAPSTPSTTQTQRNALERVNNLTIAALASDEPITPVRLLGSMEQEELLDELAMEQNPGADDSEDESDPVDGAEAGCSLAAGMHEAAMDRAEHEVDNITPLEDEFIVGLRLAFGLDAPVDIPGAPPGWKRPSAPSDWTPPAPKTEWGEPPFEKVDNPGDWNPFV